MNVHDPRIEAALNALLERSREGGPPRLGAAMFDAVFPGGGRVRPKLCLAVARACGDDAPSLSEAVACAVELLHCASLVHDDLPCFDDARTRRGRPSVHAAYGEPLAVLAGDALIVMAFEAVAGQCHAAPERLASLVSLLAESAGTPRGLVAGQGWESEASAPLRTYQRSKTGALFVAATAGGAIAAGQDPTPWRALGDALGEAYQIADDILDAVARPEDAGKPTQRDSALHRPNAVRAHGLQGAIEKLRTLVDDGVRTIPKGESSSELERLVVWMAERLLPDSVKPSAA
jgi:geranylgeranyl diphosphate synthase type II